MWDYCLFTYKLNEVCTVSLQMEGPRWEGTRKCYQKWGIRRQTTSKSTLKLLDGWEEVSNQKAIFPLIRKQSPISISFLVCSVAHLSSADKSQLISTGFLCIDNWIIYYFTRFGSESVCSWNHTSSNTSEKASWFTRISACYTHCPQSGTKKIKVPYHSIQKHYAGQLPLVSWTMSNLPQKCIEDRKSGRWKLERLNDCSLSAQVRWVNYHSIFHWLFIQSYVIHSSLNSSLYLVTSYDSLNYSYQVYSQWSALYLFLTVTGVTRTSFIFRGLLKRSSRELGWEKILSEFENKSFVSIIVR